MTSWAKPGQAVYLRENLSGETVQVGAFDPSLPGTANRMKPLPEGFTKLGIPALLRCAHLDTPWVTVDEVGYLESGMEGYQQAFRTLLENKQVAAVVRKQPLAFLQELWTTHLEKSAVSSWHRAWEDDLARTNCWRILAASR